MLDLHDVAEKRCTLKPEVALTRTEACRETERCGSWCPVGRQSGTPSGSTDTPNNGT